MEVVKELIKTEADGTLSFGDYTLATKMKLEKFEHEGDEYKVKTFCEITKLEKNGMFVYESVPGTTVRNFKQLDQALSFLVSGKGDAQFTVELEADAEYLVNINGTDVGIMKTNLSGKLSISAELEETGSVDVTIKKM
jgi:hypothetical protein